MIFKNLAHRNKTFFIAILLYKVFSMLLYCDLTMKMILTTDAFVAIRALLSQRIQSLIEW